MCVLYTCGYIYMHIYITHTYIDIYMISKFAHLFLTHTAVHEAPALLPSPAATQMGTHPAWPFRPRLEVFQTTQKIRV